MRATLHDNTPTKAELRKARRVLNVPLLVATAVAAAVLGPAAYYWHACQFNRLTKELVVEAWRIEQEGEFAKAADYYHRYLKVHPDDTVVQVPDGDGGSVHEMNVRVRLTHTFDKAATAPARKLQAIERFYDTIGREHETVDATTLQELRQRLAELLLEMAPYPPAGRYGQAEAEARKLPSGNAQGWRLLALALLGQHRSNALANRSDQEHESETALSSSSEKGTIGEAFDAMGGAPASAFERALELNPTDALLAATLAQIYRDAKELLSPQRQTLSDAERIQLANEVIDQLVAVSPNDPQALLARYQYRLQYGYEPSRARDDLAAALAVGPDNVAVLLLSAASSVQDAAKAQAEGTSRDQVSKLLDEAAGHYSHLVEIAPADPRAYLGLSQIYLTRREPAEAIKSLEQGLRECGKDDVSLNRALADLLVSFGRLDTVERLSVAERARLDDFLADDSWGLDDDRRQTLVDSLGDLLEGKTRSLSLEARKEMTRLLAEPRWGLAPAAQQRLADELARWLTAQPIESIESLDRVLAVNATVMTPAQRMEFRTANDLLRAKWHIQNRNYFEAIPLLRSVTLGQKASATEMARAFQAWMFLGDIFGATEQWDQAGVAYEEASRLDPNAVRPRRAAAAAWASAGQLDAASRGFEQVLAIEESAETWLALARVQLRQQLALPNDAREWGPFARSLSRVRTAVDAESLADPWRLPLLEADYANVRAAEEGQPERGAAEAAELLSKAEEEYPDSATLLQTLVVAYERAGRAADADRVLAKLSGLANQSGNALLLQSQLLCGRKEFEAARETLRANRETLSGNPLASALAEVQVSLAEGNVERAERELRAIFDQDPSNLVVARQLAELALQEADFSAAARWEKEVHQVEGEGGSYWRYLRARRLIAEAQDTNDPEFNEAVELHADLQGQRARWSATHLLEGLIWQRRDNPQRAIEAYQEAIRLGETRITVFERLIALLNGMRRFAEADQYLSRLKEQAPASRSLSALEISAAAGLGNTEGAVEAARRGVARRPGDASASLWLGQMLLLAGEIDEAEVAFNEAIRLAPAELAPYSGLLSFFLRTERPDEARATLERLAENVVLPDVDLALALAQGYELIGDGEKAAEQYRTAQRLAPDNAAVQGRVANFLLRNDVVEAEKVLRHILDLSPEAAGARRALAAILAARGGEEEWLEAQQLLAQAGVDTDLSALDRRLQAVLLARRGGNENRQRARDLLEQLVADPKATTAGDRLLLAQIYESEGRLLAARQQFLALVGQENPNPSHVALYVDLLIRNGLWDEADGWLATLREATPDDLATLALQTRWLAGQQRASEIEPLVEEVAERLLGRIEEGDQQRTEKQAQLSLSIGNVYNAAEQHEAAERWYRRLIAMLPTRYEPLASSLARQGRMQEAIDLCVEAADNDASAQPAVVLASLLISGKPSPEDLASAEPILAGAVERHQDNATLLAAVANVRIVEERPGDAVELYRRVVKLRPKDVVALNNLATLLSEQAGTAQEALKCIDQAIRIAGPQASLLDTKGTALIYGGKPGEAVPLLQEAAAGAGADPRYTFHLAIAYFELGEMEKAAEAFEVARAGELTSQILTQADQGFLEKLERQFGP